jgi:hypothetical protein
LFRWNLIVANVPSGVTISGTSPTDPLNIRCETTTIPKATNSAFEVNIRGHKVFQNGILTYDNSYTLTFVETVDNTVHTFFKQWRDLIWQPHTGVAQLPTNQLKGQFILQRLDNEDNPIWVYNMYGVLLQDYDIGTLDNVSSDSIKPTLTFHYDLFDDGPAS